MTHPLDKDDRRNGTRWAIEQIETYAQELKATDEGVKWHDTRPMLDPREVSPECIDLSVEALIYAEQRELIVRHPTDRHLVRITRAALQS